MKIKRCLYPIVGPVEGRLYRRLLEFGVGNGSHFLLVEPPHIVMSPQACALLEKLARYQVRSVRSSSWPGTTLLHHSAQVHEYSLTAESGEELMHASMNMANWIAPELPEDLCLLRPDGSPWLVNIAHEQESYLEMTVEELDAIRKLVPELKSRVGDALEIGEA